MPLVRTGGRRPLCAEPLLDLNSKMSEVGLQVVHAYRVAALPLTGALPPPRECMSKVKGPGSSSELLFVGPRRREKHPKNILEILIFKIAGSNVPIANQATI